MNEYENMLEHAKYAAQIGSNTPRMVTIRVELLSHIKHLKDQLQKKEELLKLLDENPVIEKFIDLQRS